MDTADKRTLFRKLLVRVFVGTAGVAALLFISARSIDFWQAWCLTAVQFAGVFFIDIYFFTRDPEVLRRRLLRKEQSLWQQLLVTSWKVLVAVSFVLAGLDHRFRWSHDFPVPVWLEVLSLVFVLGGYVLFFHVLKANRFGASIIRIESGQFVAMAGPYRLVRHPMYIAFLLMGIFSPLALGSVIAWAASLLILPIVVLRLLNEEKVLRKDLAGYAEYCRQTRYRLVPFVW